MSDDIYAQHHKILIAYFWNMFEREGKEKKKR